MIVVSAIVPVFNEEKTVAGVVRALLASRFIDEVICVNDGSTDKSPEILRALGDKIRLLDFKINRGKGFALASGIRKAAGEIVVFCDADLLNVSDKYLGHLLGPIFRGKARAVLGYPMKESGVPNVFAMLTGERAYYRKDLLPHLKRMTGTRFGVETFLNGLFDEKETVKVPLVGLKGFYKHEKYAPKEALKEYVKEAIEIVREMGNREVVSAEDLKAIKRLSRVVTVNSLELQVKKIGNERVRNMLEKYVLRYIKMVKV